MKQIAVLSGKGGTGKTSIAAALARLSHLPLVMADCDVDAANLALTFARAPDSFDPFVFGQKGAIDPQRCNGCGACIDVCRFDAVTLVDGLAEIRPLACEGCRACQVVCPSDAVRLAPHTAGAVHIRVTEFGALVHAALGVAEGNSGKLVATVREKAKQTAIATRCKWVLIDGPPGIGCPVHASMSGVDLVVAVTEPTPSGAADLNRLLDLCHHFGVPAVTIVNKFNLSMAMTETIERESIRRKVTPIGRIGFDALVPKKLCAGQSYLDVPSVFTQIKAVWHRVCDYL